MLACMSVIIANYPCCYVGFKNISDLVSHHKRKQSEDRFGKQNCSSKPAAATTGSSARNKKLFLRMFVQWVVVWYIIKTFFAA